LEDKAMPQYAYILIVVFLVLALIALFIVTFVVYKKTPAPKGCEDLGPSEEKCSKCTVEGCHLNIYAGQDKKEDGK
jgi:flagellar basal body-associated protein FliL